MRPGYQRIINRFLSDSGSSVVYRSATEYWGSNGRVQSISEFGGSWLDTTPFPAGDLTDQDIIDTVERAILVNGWKAGLESSFFVLLGSGPHSDQFCAYHSSVELDGVTIVYGAVAYLDLNNPGDCATPFGITPNRNLEADSAVNSLSHEQMEMVTDPLGDAWYDTASQNEIADICLDSYGLPFGPAGGNLTVNSHEYIVQEIWSQKRHSCQPNL